MSLKGTLEDKDVAKSIGFGFRMLPAIIRGIETLFGKKTGQTKKQAVHDIANAAMVGVAMGYSATGDTQIANAVQTFQPVVSESIDAIVANYNADGTFAKDEAPITAG